MATFTDEISNTSLRDNAIAKLLTILKPGDHVYTITRHATRKTRCISVVYPELAVSGAITLSTLDYWIRLALGYKISPRHGGMMVPESEAELVHSLGCALWPKGTVAPHSKRNGKPDSSGGYALVHVPL